MSHIGDDLTVLRRDLGVLDQLVKVLLRDPCFATHAHTSHVTKWLIRAMTCKLRYKMAAKDSLTVLQENVEQDDADLVVGADVGIQQDWHDGPHGVFNLFTLCVCSHSEILPGDRAQLINYAQTMVIKTEITLMLSDTFSINSNQFSTV